MAKKRICLIAFKPARTTIHVLRQINYLAPDYALTVIGHGEADPAWPALTWHAVPAQTGTDKVAKLGWYALGRALPASYDAWFWSVSRHRLAYAYALASGADAYHANDWPALPIAVAAARRTGRHVVYHIHEYAEEERAASPLWSQLVSPAIRYLNRRYTSGADHPLAATLTVCEPIAERYRHELGITPLVVYNAPAPAPDRARPTRRVGGPIRLIHHGYAKRGRGLHHLIEALALTDRRFTLDLMLVEDDAGYIRELQGLAARRAPGRVYFRAPVPPTEIVRTVADYDLGLCAIEPTSYNNLMMLPNKFFEYIQGGLALCIGPSPAMVALVERHNLGVIASDFSPATVAAALMRLTEPALQEYQAAARRAATVLNADVEMGKVVALYRELLGAPTPALAAATSGRAVAVSPAASEWVTP